MILAVDLGMKTTGLAISAGNISSPLQTITHRNLKEAVDKISAVCEKESVNKLILGFVEGKIKKYFDEFEKKFKSVNPHIEIVKQDETLTSRQATETMIRLGISKNRRKQREHEVAASIILEDYLKANND